VNEREVLLNAAPARKHAPRILLADDHPGVVSAAAGVLALHFDIVGTVSDGRAALEAAEREGPDLVLLDIAMPELNGIQAATELKQKHPHTTIVFLTGQEDDDYISEALAAGARGYVVKRRLQSDLLPAVNVALEGHLFISPHSFIGAPRHAQHEHVLEFYLDESIFLSQTYQLAYTALAKGERVLTVLGQTELNCLATRLRAAGVDLAQAIACLRYRAFSVEHVMPLLMRDNWPDAAHFAVLFDPMLRRLAAYAREESSRVTIFADIMGSLLRQGCRHEIAARVEEIWNNLVQRHCCIVYCGCPAMHLSSKGNRETLAEMCVEHSDVIPIGT